MDVRFLEGGVRLTEIAFDDYFTVDKFRRMERPEIHDNEWALYEVQKDRIRIRYFIQPQNGESDYERQGRFFAALSEQIIDKNKNYIFEGTNSPSS